MEYWVLAYYCIVPLEDPRVEVARHKEFLSERDIRCRIYLSEQGINGQTSARADHAREYIDWVRSDPRFKDIEFKIHLAKEHAFPKAAVKYRRQLVAIDRDLDLGKRGESVPPAVWKEMLEKRGEDTVIVDVRNDYEWKVGHFEGADLPRCGTFREFSEYARELKEKRDPSKTAVMMYCTGGIRCEFYSALLKEEGFDAVYQLEGGVIGYGLKEGADHWKGKLFVFDDRLVVPIAGETAASIASCSHCGISLDVYYNCANMDCNELFISCPDCLREHKGCCSAKCREEGRVRPYREDGSAKPFRKFTKEEKEALAHP